MGVSRAKRHDVYKVEIIFKARGRLIHVKLAGNGASRVHLNLQRDILVIETRTQTWLVHGSEKMLQLLKTELECGIETIHELMGANSPPPVKRSKSAPERDVRWPHGRELRASV